MLVHIVDTQLVEEFQLWLANAAVLERQAIIRIAPALKKKYAIYHKKHRKSTTTNNMTHLGYVEEFDDQ